MRYPAVSAMHRGKRPSAFPAPFSNEKNFLAILERFQYKNAYILGRTQFAEMKKTVRNAAKPTPLAYTAGPLRPETAEAMLRASGVRMTPQRRVVLQILDGNRTHPTAAGIVEQARERLGCVSVATIYNTLETLVALGLVRRLDVMESSMHFDPDTSPHHHFVCRECHRVLDVPQPLIDTMTLPGGHAIEDVILKGICAKCVSDKAKQKRTCKQ